MNHTKQLLGIIRLLFEDLSHAEMTLTIEGKGKIADAINDLNHNLSSSLGEFKGQEFASDIKNTIGEHSLREIALEAGMSISTLSRLQRGGPPDIDTFAKLCRWMGVSPSKYF